MKINSVRIGFISMVVIAVAIVYTFSFFKKKEPRLLPSAGNGFAVVELFTSEGCSSCPAADDVVAKLSANYKQNVYVLGFHVDYWNRLGWKDEFSNSIYSDRQREYAETFKLNGVYTPQVVVNGKKELVGSDAGKLKGIVEAELRSGENIPIQLTASANGSKEVKVSWQIEKAPGNTFLQIALVQLQTQTNVRNGENSGRKLNHINIVRDFHTVNTQQQSGTSSLLLPAGVGFKECKVIAWLQQNKTSGITGAAAATIN